MQSEMKQFANELSGKQIRRDLEGGMTRYKKNDMGWGSIEEKYGMTPKEVEIFFRNPKISELRTIPQRFILIDDFDMTLNLDEFKEPELPSDLMQADFDAIGLANKVNHSSIIEEDSLEAAGFIPDYMNRL